MHDIIFHILSLLTLFHLIYFELAISLSEVVNRLKTFLCSHGPTSYYGKGSFNWSS